MEKMKPGRQKMDEEDQGGCIIPPSVVGKWISVQTVLNLLLQRIFKAAINWGGGECIIFNISIKKTRKSN